jgi:hypothetical protein
VAYRVLPVRKSAYCHNKSEERASFYYCKHVRQTVVVVKERKASSVVIHQLWLQPSNLRRCGKP